jgi:hypothetical protein
MSVTVTNQSKNTATATNLTPTGYATWDDSAVSWDDSFEQWGPYQIAITNLATNTVSVTNQPIS